jgi:ActR/RegA family two-component response regulator
MTKNQSILILDDNEKLARQLAFALAREGYDVKHSTNVEAVLEDLRKSASPTFILADRLLEEPIEQRNLERICEAAPSSKVLVYTRREDLGEDTYFDILNRGAFRVLDKSAISKLINDIKLFARELAELTDLAAKLEEAASDRSKIMAALVGSDVSVSVVDKHYRRWFQNDAPERSAGGVCRTTRCRTASFGGFSAPRRCWGCTVSRVLDGGKAVEDICLNRSEDKSLNWLAVRSTPIIGQDQSILAVREAVTVLDEIVLAGLPSDRRLFGVAESIVRLGFGRARVYRATSETEIFLQAAASRSDSSHAFPSQYFESVKEIAVHLNACPYMMKAYTNKRGLLVAKWDPDLGMSPYVDAPLYLELPYFDIPIWRDDGRLDGWIAADFVGVDDTLRGRAINRLAIPTTVSCLQTDYGPEARRALDLAGGRPEQQQKFEIVQRARLEIAGAKSVADATNALRRAFSELFHGCRVSVRLCAAGHLREFDDLCIGPRTSEAPIDVPVSNTKSLASAAVRRQQAFWIDDYSEHRTSAAASGGPQGLCPPGTKSSAHVPLRFEYFVVGVLSIHSFEPIQWKRQGYDGPILYLSKDVALVLRELAHLEELERAMDDLAAVTAYSVSVSADALWKHWSQQRLTEASALIATARLRLEQDITNAKEMSELLIQASSAIQRAQSARPRPEPPESSIAEAFSTLATQYSSKVPVPVFECEIALKVNAPLFIVRNILVVLIDNSQRAMRESRIGGSITVAATSDDTFAIVQVTDDGPGVSDTLRAELFRRPIKATSGQGVGLLYSRGAALEYGGNLVHDPTGSGARFTLTLPLKDRPHNII